MIRRSKHLNFKRLRYFFWQKDQINNLLNKSFLKNFYLEPKTRLSFIIQQKYYNKEHKFYGSQNKLQCSMSFSFSVPNKRINQSRFYLNKALDRLMHGGYQKY